MLPINAEIVRTYLIKTESDYKLIFIYIAIKD